MEHQLTVNERIALTVFSPDDKPNLVKYMNDPVLFNNTIRVPHPYTMADADWWLDDAASRQASLGGFPANLAIRHQEAGVIGGIGIFAHTGLDGHRDELGYWLAQPFRNQGIMSEIVQQFTAWQFDQRPNLLRMEALVLTENAPSLRLLEKAGFVREGVLRQYLFKRGRAMDAVMLSRLRG